MTSEVTAILEAREQEEKVAEKKKNSKKNVAKKNNEDEIEKKENAERIRRLMEATMIEEEKARIQHPVNSTGET